MQNEIPPVAKHVAERKADGAHEANDKQREATSDDKRRGRAKAREATCDEARNAARTKTGGTRAQCLVSCHVPSKADIRNTIIILNNQYLKMTMTDGSPRNWLHAQRAQAVVRCHVSC
jgi:hypothetical protein